MRRLLLIWTLLLTAICTAFGQLPLTGVGPGGFGGGTTTTTFDPANKAATLNLSGGNLVATGAVGAGNGTNVRTLSSYSTGKKYAEFTLTTVIVNSQTLSIGIGNGTFAIGAGFLGNDNNGTAAYGDRSAYLNSIPTANILSAAPIQADVICVATDITNAKIWWRVNGGIWNGSGLADPATNTGGFDFSVLGAVPIFSFVEVEIAAAVITANYGTSAYAQVTPVGFGNW